MNTQSPEHHIIIVPGLGNRVNAHIWVTREWKKFGLIPHIFNTQWKIAEPYLESKLARAIELVDELSSRTTLVSLVGNSAGSSFVLNMFHQRKDKIHKVVVNCGRVRTGNWPWYTFTQATTASPSFKESVLKSEKLIQTLSQGDKQKILTIRPFFDEIVPPHTVPIDGAINEITPCIGHGISIALNMIQSGRIRKYLQE